MAGPLHNEDEAPRVREIFELYLDRQSLIETAKELDTRGWTTKRWVTKKGLERSGKPFGKNSLFKLLTNRIYLGKITYKDEVYEDELRRSEESDHAAGGCGRWRPRSRRVTSSSLPPPSPRQGLSLANSARRSLHSPAMGDRNSSLTRVVPVMRALFDRDPTGRKWLDRLIAMPVGGLAPPQPNVSILGEVEEGRGLWGDHEKRLAPPRSLLTWLVRNLSPDASLSGSGRTVRKRRLLAERDPATTAEALRLLDRDELPDTGWYILEGISCPDAFIRTPSAIVVIEGKRTEPIPTRKTTWMPVRDQLLRHIDCACEIRGTCRVFGMLVVEGRGGAEAVDVPSEWLGWVRESQSRPILEASLPHRSDAERAEIADAVLGVTTWQRLCVEFGIPWASLPDRC